MHSDSVQFKGYLLNCKFEAWNEIESSSGWAPSGAFKSSSFVSSCKVGWASLALAKFKLITPYFLLVCDWTPWAPLSI